MNYQDAIKILQDVAEGKRDALGLLFTLARIDPDALIRAANAVDAPAWTTEALDALRRGMKIECIKIIRMARGLGLKEAKDIADEIGQMNGATERQLIERLLR